MVWLVFIFIVAPLVVALGMTGVVIADAFAILPLYYYSISFLIRLSIAGCRTKLWLNLNKTNTFKKKLKGFKMRPAVKIKVW